jgi:DNA-binding MurR/RpiR family transcriptional regulator
MVNKDTQSSKTETSRTDVSILSRIRQEMPYLSVRHKMIANYILSNYEEAAFLTSTQLAEESGTSEATVIRFAKHFKFERYTDLQKTLRNLVRRKLTQIERLEKISERHYPDSPLRMITDSMRTDIRSIEQTLSELREEDISAIIELITNARRVYVIGSHSEFGLACYFATTLSWIKENVYLTEEAYNLSSDTISSISEKDVAVAISYPPYPTRTIQLLKAAYNGGAKTIVITDSLASPLASMGTYLLSVHNEQISFADNSAPIMSLLTALLALISSNKFNKSARRLRILREYWKQTDFYYQEE